MCQFPSKINAVNFYLQSKPFILNYEWAKLPKASQAIFPVIACFANSDGFAFPGKETISALSGCHLNTVQAGIKGLEKVNEIIDIKRYPASNGYWGYQYQIKIPLNEKGQTFPFFRSVLECGNWAKVLNTGKSLYMAMRTFSKYDDSIGYVQEEYLERNFEICKAERSVLCELAGITQRSFSAAIVSLRESFLIETMPENQHRVFIKSLNNYK